MLLIQDCMRYEQQADGCAKDMLLGRGGKSLAMMIRAMHVVMYGHLVRLAETGCGHA